MQKRSRVDLDNIRVASPCPAPWEEMTGDDRVRRCDLCSLNVYNTAGLSRPELEELILSRRGERLCVRLYKRHDGKVITKDCPVGVRAAFRRSVRSVGAALSLILGLVAVGFGQEKPSDKPSNTKTEQSSTVNKIELTGTATDQAKAVIPGVEVKVYEPKKKKPIGKAMTDGDGNFRILLSKPGNYIVKFTMSPFAETVVNTGELKLNEKKRLDVIMEVEVTVWVGIIFEEPLIDMTSSEISTTIRPERFDR